MAFIRATLDPKTETVTVNGSTFEHPKWWWTQEGVSNTEGVWDDINNKFIPDGYFDRTTGHITPLE